MSQISNVVRAAVNLFQGECGLQSNLSALAANEVTPPITLATTQLLTQNIPPEIVERSTAVRYPSVQIYCDKIVNALREKFRTFSGDADMVIEIRVSTDRLADLDTQLNLMVDAVTTTLDQNRGDWGGGMFYSGGYNITLGGIKHGGKNFIQIAKVAFTLNISTN